MMKSGVRNGGKEFGMTKGVAERDLCSYINLHR